MTAPYPARFWHLRPDGKLQCDLCPRDCRLAPGQRGFCSVRRREGNRMVLTAYGRASGLCVDPIEKKPLFHFLPGSRVLSFGTAGCNLGCRFCQNWTLTRSRDEEAGGEATGAREATPEGIADLALRLGCASVAFTYNDPVIFTEYAIDVAEACRARGLQTIAVTAGYVHAAPRAELFAAMDAANVDLKAFTEGFYAKLSGGHLQPVLETLEYLARETNVWLEVTTLLIPGHNDGDAELEALAAWVAERLGRDVPLHFSAFHPDHQLRGPPPTPPETLLRARAIAARAGLRYVYGGNVRDPSGEVTRCPGCASPLVRRDRFELREYRLTPDGRCPGCGAALPGRYGEQAGPGGRRRIPILPVRPS